MSIFKANKKWLSVAQTAMSNAEVIAEKQKDINFGRELLANIRQYRIEQAAVDQAEASIGATQVSGVQTARQFLQRQLNEPYSRTLQDAERQEKIEEYQNQAQAALDRFKKQAKTAKTTGYISAIVLGAAGGFLGAAAVAGAAAAGAAGGALIGGTVATVGGRAMGADRNFMAGGIQGTTTATIAAGTIGYGAGSAGFASTTTGGTVVKAGAAGSHSWTSVGAAETVTTQGWSALSMFSAANTVFSRLGKDMQYLSQDPQLRVQLRGFA